MVLQRARMKSRLGCYAGTLLLLISTLHAQRTLSDAWEGVSLSSAHASKVATADVLPANQGAQDVPAGGVLPLCQCENASTADNGGLNCEKEGWFLSSFEAQGQWMQGEWSGGAYVPLSRARCCRICVPDELPDQVKAKLPAGATALTVISIGCHSSTVPSKVACEALQSNSFMSGFQNKVHVPAHPATFYPEGPALCCTPVLQLSTGDAWEITRCGCTWSSQNEVGCAADHLLQGYAGVRRGGDRAPVPVAPAWCCQACIGDRIHQMDRCDTLDHCHDHGVCAMGTCQCNSGWGGADCSKQMRAQDWLPQWVQYVLMATSVLLSTIVWVVVHRAITDWAERRRVAIEEASAALDPLLLTEGSVGEDDTDDDGADEDLWASQSACANTRPSLQSVPVPLEPARREIANGTPEIEPTPDAAHRSVSVRNQDETAAALARIASLPRAEQTELVPRLNSSRSALADAMKDAECTDGKLENDDDDDDVEPMDPELAAYLANKFDERKSPLAGIKCSICCDRPVQVALVPCGHSNLCRRCARRLTECPFCRKEIVRRQRLYIAD